MKANVTYVNTKIILLIPLEDLSHKWIGILAKERMRLICKFGTIHKCTEKVMWPVECPFCPSPPFDRSFIDIWNGMVKWRTCLNWWTILHSLKKMARPALIIWHPFFKSAEKLSTHYNPLTFSVDSAEKEGKIHLARGDERMDGKLSPSRQFE